MHISSYHSINATDVNASNAGTKIDVRGAAFRREFSPEVLRSSKAPIFVTVRPVYAYIVV